MIKSLPFLKVVVFIFFLSIAEPEGYCQTTGTFDFSVTTTSTGGFSPSHLLAIWIQNNNVSGSSAGFVKTKIKYCSNGNLDHLQTWVNSSGQDVTDATTGATLTSHGTITFLWNGTDVSGTLISDGTYYTWLEMAWAQDLTTGKTVNSYSFTKGPSLFQSSPANTANFLSLSLTWTPLTTGIKGILENPDVKVYPNPTSGQLYIDFKHPEKECSVNIFNADGVIRFQKKISDLHSGPETFDLSLLPSGTYYCTLHFPGKDIVFTVILSK